MRLRKQDYPAVALYLLGFSRLRNLLSRLKMKPLVRFIAFHDVPESSRSAFHAKLQFLKEKTHIVSIADYFAGKLCSRRINVVITFDDGYKSWTTTAAPALKEFGMPATFFISSGFVGVNREEERRFLALRLRTKADTTGALNEADVQELARQSFTIGGHTCSHTNLCELRDESEITREITSDKVRLGTIARTSIDYFAYPFGACENDSVDLPSILRTAGYQGAVTTVPGFNTPSVNPYLLKRELTDAAMPLAAFKARVYGNHDAITLLKTAARLIHRVGGSQSASTQRGAGRLSSQ